MKKIDSEMSLIVKLCFKAAPRLSPPAPTAASQPSSRERRMLRGNEEHPRAPSPAPWDFAKVKNKSKKEARKCLSPAAACATDRLGKDGPVKFFAFITPKTIWDGERQSQSRTRSSSVLRQPVREAHGCATIPGLHPHCCWRPAESPHRSAGSLRPCLSPGANRSSLASAARNTNLRRPYKGPCCRPVPGRRERRAVPQAPRVILNQRSEVQNAISRSASHIQPRQRYSA